MKDVLNIVLDNWEILSVVMYEIIARLYPTKWNISILDNAWKVINLLITNRRLLTGREQFSDTSDGSKNVVEVNVNKHILK